MLQRPPPLMRIFRPPSRVRSSSTVSAPAEAAKIAAIDPAAPAPMTAMRRRGIGAMYYSPSPVPRASHASRSRRQPAARPARCPRPGGHRRSASTRLHRRVGPGRARMGGEVPGDPRAGLAPLLHASALRAATPPGLATGQRQRRLDPRSVPRLGARRADRDVPRALSHAARASRGARRTGAFRRPPARAGPAPGPDLQPAIGAAPDLQRLFSRRRRHRAARVRQLRRARGLRPARAPRHLGQGGHRDRALRPVVARHQAQGGRRARGRRLSDLLRSA